MMINPSPVYIKTESESKVQGVEAMIIVVVTIITLIISLITSIRCILVVTELIPGSEPIQYNENSTLIRKQLTVFNQVCLNGNQIEIRDSILGYLGLDTPNTHLKMNADQIEFYAKEEFTIKSHNSKKKIFPPDFNQIVFAPISQLTITNGLQNVYKIRSPTDQNLEINSSGRLTFRGNNGIKLDGKQINMKSEKILLNSSNATINFETTSGEIYFQFDNLYTSKKQHSAHKSDSSLDKLDYDNYQYKLCVCGSSGLIFKLTVKDDLKKFSDVRFPVSTNPCRLKQIM